MSPDRHAGTGRGRGRGGFLAPLRAVWRRLRALDAPELLALIALTLVAAGVWAFLALADEVRDGELERFDRAILLALRERGDPADPVGPPWFEEVLRDFTALGGIGVQALVITAVAVFLALQRKWRSAVFVVLAVLGGIAMSSLLKGIFERPRPNVVPHVMHVSSHSFPSGHSMMSAVTWLTLAALLARSEKKWRTRIFLLAAAAFVVLLVGASRVYLGVHWPSDVLAGWAAGASWATLMFLIEWRLQRRGAIERAS